MPCCIWSHPLGNVESSACIIMTKLHFICGTSQQPFGGLHLKVSLPQLQIAHIGRAPIAVGQLSSLRIGAKVSTYGLILLTGDNLGEQTVKTPVRPQPVLKLSSLRHHHSSSGSSSGSKACREVQLGCTRWNQHLGINPPLRCQRSDVCPTQ